MQLSLDNTNGQWSSWSSEAQVNIDAGLAVQIILQGLPHFTGRVDTWAEHAVPQGSAPGRNADAWVQIDATDACADLALAPGLTTTPPAELSGARVNRILATAGWAGNVSIDAGTQNMGPWSRNTQALDELWLVADSEGGMFFVDDSGQATFWDQGTMDANDSSAPVVTFADDGTGISYADISPTVSRNDVVNLASIAHTSGTAFSAVNNGSLANYGPRTFQRLDLVHSDDAHSQSLANRIVDRLGSSGPSITLTVFPDPTNYSVMAGLFPGKMAEVIYHSTTGDLLDMTCQVDNVTHAITPQVWQCTVALSRVITTNPFARWDVGLWDQDSWSN
jgi:hypothetical protein